MLIKTIENKENGTKWEIYKISENEYGCRYFELYAGEWVPLFPVESGYAKDVIEYEFDIKIA